MTKNELKGFAYFNIALLVIGILYCTYDMIRGTNPISFLVIIVFAGMLAIEINKLRKGLKDED
jgi:FtsH-binding integral membrane protein